MMREFDLLKEVFAANTALPKMVTIPPGDDMGAVQFGDEQVLVTVDQVAEGVHFVSGTSMEMIARKAITRNVSDVAAMGCQPMAAVAAACLPREVSQSSAQSLCDQLRRYAAEYGCPLVGGDIAVWDQPMVITVTVLARRWRRDVEPVLRSGAQVGDLVYVTGKLGGSFASGRHLCFEPRVEVARQLVMSAHFRWRPTAMIDLSDGLGRDLGHICEMSKVGAVVEVSRLPMYEDVVSVNEGEPAWQHGLADGEDYELCFTMPPSSAKLLPCAIDGVSLSCIGEIVAAEGGQGEFGVKLKMEDGSVRSAAGLGWEHTT